MLFCLLDEVLRCGERQGRGLIHLASRLQNVQKRQVLYPDDVARLSAYLQDLSKRVLVNPDLSDNPIKSLALVLRGQARHQRLPESAVAFVESALEFPDGILSDNTLLSILVNQLKYHDSRIEPLLWRVVNSDRQSKSRVIAMKSLGIWYAHPDRAEQGVARIHPFCEEVESADLSASCMEVLASIASQLKDGSLLQDTVYAGLGAVGKAEVIEAKLERLQAAGLKRALSQHELEWLFRIQDEYQSYLHPSKGWLAPSATILRHAKRHGLTQEEYEKLLINYVQRHDSLSNYSYLREYFIGSYPYRIDQIVMPGAPYSENFVRRLLEVVIAERVAKTRRVGLEVIHVIVVNQPVSRDNLALALNLGLRDDTDSGFFISVMKAFPDDETLAEYQPHIEALRADLRRQHPRAIHDAFPVVLRYDALQMGELEALFGLFEDDEINEEVRYQVLMQLVRRTPPVSARRILHTSERSSLDMQRWIWITLRDASKSGLVRVQQDALQDATRHKDISIRHAAWDMLELQGVNPPVGVVIKRYLYELTFGHNRNYHIFKLTQRLFPVVLIAGLFLIRPSRKLRERGATLSIWRLLLGIFFAYCAVLTSNLAIFLLGLGAVIYSDFTKIDLGILGLYLFLMYLLRPRFREGAKARTDV